MHAACLLLLLRHEMNESQSSTVAVVIQAGTPTTVVIDNQLCSNFHEWSLCQSVGSMCWLIPASEKRGSWTERWLSAWINTARFAPYRWRGACCCWKNKCVCTCISLLTGAKLLLCYASACCVFLQYNFDYFLQDAKMLQHSGGKSGWDHRACAASLREWLKSKVETSSFKHVRKLSKHKV